MKNKNSLILVIIVAVGVIGAGVGSYLAFRHHVVKVSNHSTQQIVLEKDSGIVVTIVAYCPCAICNEQWPGLVCTGHKIAEFIDKGINICAVDPTVIPLGSKVIYRDKEYLATDVGAKIKGQMINILLPTHAETEEFGRKTEQLVVIKNEK